ncbi:hypothetical protein BKA66DRAFT_573407 [Pyrenochaeta sp. MPI-SDFR-AT-0127]|nr:hypothetical protein BKA66DRAFT_573407 [Pyrenochaeta sp. MPI-SDFR-AT-0127]
MRSFAVIAGFAAAANAYAYGYPAYNTTSVAPPTYETSKAPEYPAYPESSKAPEYPAYPESSKAPEYPSYPEAPAYTTTKVVTGLTTVCPEPTTVTYGHKTYTVKSSTTLIDDDCEYTTTYEVKPTPTPVKPTGHYAPPAYSSAPPVVPYPSKNATTPYPTGVKPSSTKPVTPEFTGAAAQAGVGLMAVIGAVAAFL